MPICYRDQYVVPSILQHRKNGNLRVVIPSQMQLQKQRAHTDEARKRKDPNRGGRFLADIDLAVCEMVQHSQSLEVCQHSL